MKKNLRLFMLSLLMAVTGTALADSWVKTSASDLKTGDVVAIVDEASSTAMINGNGASSAPVPQAVAIEAGKLSEEAAENIQWTVTVKDGTYQFSVGSDYLYCTNTNNGVRVGSNANNKFLIKSDDTGNDYLYNDGTQRYLGVYHSDGSPKDWRCYTSIHNNIKDTRVAFYKRTGDGTVTKKIATVKIGDTTFNVGETTEVTTDGPALTLATSDASIASVSGTTVTGVAAGEATITATWAENDEFKGGSKVFNVTVSDPNAPGSEANPYTVAQALEIISKLDDGAKTPNSVYVKGVISAIDEVSVQHGNATYDIVDEGAQDALTIFRGKYLDNAAFTAADQINVDDVVVVYGQLHKYVKDEVVTPEMAQGNYIVSIVPAVTPVEIKEAGLAYSAEKAEVTINANDNVYPTLSNPNNLSPILFTSSNADVATVDAQGNVELKAAGETTITASFEGNDEYKAGNASYVLTVYEEIVIPLKDAEIAYDVKEFNAYIGDEVNFPVLSNPYSLPVTFNSTHPEYATVDENGFVTLVAPGRTSIEAIFAGDDEYEDKTVSYMLNVMEHPQKGTEVFDLVTDASTLSAGDEFVIVSSYTDASGLTKYFALGDVQNNNNRAAVEIEMEADGTVMPHTTTQRITLEGEAGAWNLYVVGDPTAENKPTGYLYASSNSSNQLRTEAAVDDKGNADATITITDGIATIKFQREGGRNDLRFNNSSTIFACYADNNNQQPVQIFRKRLEYMDVNISEAGYATLYYSDKNLQVPAGVKAYTVKVAGNAAVVSKEYNVIPAGSAVILQGTPGDHEFAIKIKGDEVDADNMLMGTDEEAMTVAPADGSYKFYKLADGKSHGLGFYFDAEGGAAFMNGAHKAYLAVEASKAVEAYGFNPTGIRSVMANLPEGSEVYTISGVRVDSTNLPAGLYIVNGKKIVVK